MIVNKIVHVAAYILHSLVAFAIPQPISMKEGSFPLTSCCGLCSILPHQMAVKPNAFNGKL